MSKKNIHIKYFAILREHAQKSEETFLTDANDAQELYEELKSKYDFPLASNLIRAAINSEILPLNSSIKDNDQIAFIPPVAGG